MTGFKLLVLAVTVGLSVYSVHVDATMPATARKKHAFAAEFVEAPRGENASMYEETGETRMEVMETKGTRLIKEASALTEPALTTDVPTTAGARIDVATVTLVSPTAGNVTMGFAKGITVKAEARRPEDMKLRGKTKARRMPSASSTWKKGRWQSNLSNVS